MRYVWFKVTYHHLDPQKLTWKPLHSKTWPAFSKGQVRRVCMPNFSGFWATLKIMMKSTHTPYLHGAPHLLSSILMCSHPLWNIQSFLMCFHPRLKGGLYIQALGWDGSVVLNTTVLSGIIIANNSSICSSAKFEIKLNQLNHTRVRYNTQNKKGNWLQW